ncbi:MAG: RIP metalloprotease RseP [Pseudomonadota bacterium]
MELTNLIPQFGGLIYTIGAFILALSIIVAIHEYGHYIVGRWCGIYAEVFSLGFGPVLFSRVDKRGTKWQFALLPLGGYVKFLGDADAASAKDSAVMEAIPEDRKRMTMHGAPLWARACTVAAGPVFNFILSFLIFGAILFFRGQPTDPLTIDTLVDLPPAYEVALQPGDEILAINGTPAPELEDFDAFVRDLPTEQVLDYRVLRDGVEVTVEGPYPYPPHILGLSPRSAAMDVNLRVGDVITAVDNAPIHTFDALRTAVADADGKPLQLDVWRDGTEMEFVLAPKRVDLPQPDGSFETRWLIGISGGLFFDAATERGGVGQSLVYGVEQTYFIVRSSLSGLYNMITGAISSCNLSGPIGIAQTSSAMASQGAQSFIYFIAVLSTAVGLLNLFPIPVLDGGHLVFHAYEAVTGKPPSDRALRVLMGVGLTLLLSLMVFALGNDLFCP